MIYQNFFKRKIDILFSISFIIFFFWLYIIVFIYIFSISGNPVFFFQKRIGKNSKSFNIIKFRTFKNNKIIFSGRILRKYKIDEIPQFFNILRGDMSLIGPRPLRPKHRKEILSYSGVTRSKVLPGLIGPAQIAFMGWQKNPHIYFEKDLNYVNKINFLIDLKIFLKFLIFFLGIK